MSEFLVKIVARSPPPPPLPGAPGASALPPTPRRPHAIPPVDPGSSPELREQLERQSVGGVRTTGDGGEEGVEGGKVTRTAQGVYGDLTMDAGLGAGQEGGGSGQTPL